MNNEIKSKKNYKILLISYIENNLIELKILKKIKFMSLKLISSKIKIKLLLEQLLLESKKDRMVD
jgi:hypothetical protein